MFEEVTSISRKEHRVVCAGPIGEIPQVHVRPYRMTSKKQYEAGVVEMQSQRYSLLQLLAGPNCHGMVGERVELGRCVSMLRVGRGGKSQ